MSFKVAVVCEDPTYDRYLIEPVIQRACAEVGRPRAQVRTVTSPRVYGVSELKAHVCDFIRKWGPNSAVVVFVVDADGEDGSGGKPDRRAQFEAAIQNCDSSVQTILVVARQEVEVWALWGCYKALDVPWTEVIGEPHSKERFFEPQLTEDDARLADGGRRRLIAASLAKGWRSLCKACPELADLERALKAAL